MMKPRDFVLSWSYRTLAVGLMSTTTAVAQPATLEQRIAVEIGQCSLQRAGLAAENDALKARVAALEAKAAEKKD